MRLNIPYILLRVCTLIRLIKPYLLSGEGDKSIVLSDLVNLINPARWPHGQKQYMLM